MRTLFPRLHKSYWLLQTLWRIRFYARLPLPTKLKPAPTLIKIPLVRWVPGIRFESVHFTSPIKLSAVTAVLLHFKFIGDFHNRMRIEAGRKEYWDNASEHVRYLSQLKRSSDLCLYHAESAVYEGSDQLVRLGLIKEDEEWAQIRRGRMKPSDGLQVSSALQRDRGS